jgi:hypothetical protein
VLGPRKATVQGSLPGAHAAALASHLPLLRLALLPLMRLAPLPLLPQPLAPGTGIARL